MRVLGALAAIALVVILGFVLGWAFGYVVAVALLVAFPVLLFAPSARRRATEPGTSGPGSPGYDGRTNVGDEGGH